MDHLNLDRPNLGSLKIPDPAWPDFQVRLGTAATGLT